jgi:limonene-1,2-epoxide hydrolase
MSRTTKEEKLAIAIVDLLSDLRLNLDMAGMYLSQMTRIVAWRRFEEVYEVAKEHKESVGDMEKHYDYIRNI